MANKNDLSSIRDFYNDIQEDMEKYTKNIAKEMTKKIADEMTKVAQSAMESFYANYSPVYYNRHNNFLKSYKRYYRNHDPKFYGGVELLMFEIPDVYSGSNSTPLNVFWRVYNGYHGIASFQSAKGTIKHEVPIMSPSPIDIIEEKYEEILANLPSYEADAAKTAKKSGYARIF